MAKEWNGERREPVFDGFPEPEEKPRRAPPKKRKSKRKKRPPLLSRLVYWLLMLGLWGAVGASAVVAYYAAQLPPIDQLAIPKRPPNIAILDDNGTLLANRGDMGGAAVHLAELPPYLPKAFVAIEDRRFYDHWGIDPIGILRALVRDATGHGGMEGGSTLTQQLAKNLFLTQERTVSRKIQEAILALWLEHKYSKDQILELYLNRVYFGSGAFGVEAASQKYFGHSARDVTLAEAAMLGGLMKAPSRYAPNHNLAAATDRARDVVNAMLEQGFITKPMAELALAQPAKPVKLNGGTINYVADYVMDQLDALVGPVDEDISVRTTISAPLQTAAEQALREALSAKGAHYDVTQGALVALDPDGALRALVGGRDYSESQFDRATSAKRQPGSAFKPFVYLTALEHGLTPDSVRNDAPINLRGWQPENYEHRYMGPVTLTTALANSLNTVAVRVGLEVGPAAVARTAHQLGITSNLDINPTIALGTSAVTPLELTSAYVPFANGGIAVAPYVIARVATANGHVLYQHAPSTNGSVIAPDYVAMMNRMLSETLISGTARRADLPGWQAAGKTGTSQDFRDAWFIGYTSHMTCGVWLGNDDNSPTKRASGGSLPVVIWSRFMQVAHAGLAPAPLVDGIWSEPVAPNIPVANAIVNFFAGQSQPAAQTPPSQHWPRAAQTQSAPSRPARRDYDGRFLPPASIPNGSEANRQQEKPFFGLF
ncbi:penicillin-binding protein [Methylovirgula ligni]|uniref:Penicillin-binding protein 1A n=1 Tax=Methylovirgula ligni TaxID=569860 RepID=A0A3D9YRL2_9HYPH|nr:penicillin-binding protein 1A [Methylovirgula ligni]QAY94872.1 penicillin-binding protein [Methylovirgula ligni]REF84698.1 penicillin-binding protein 1A [Methylovirgula ligni]